MGDGTAGQARVTLTGGGQPKRFRTTSSAAAAASMAREAGQTRRGRPASFRTRARRALSAQGVGLNPTGRRPSVANAVSQYNQVFGRR